MKPCLSDSFLAALGGLLLLPTAVSGASALNLTGVTIFSINSSGLYDGVNGWDTVPTNGLPNVWVYSGYLHYNGVTDATADIDTPLTPSTFAGLFSIAGSAGSPFEPYHGINLFFNGSTVPQISAYQPTACGAGPPPPFAGSSLGLGGVVTAADSVRCVVEDLEIELAGYLWSPPSCALLDFVSPFDFIGDGTNDCVGVFSLQVRELPRLSIWRTATNTAVISWPSTSITATGFGLERAPALPAPSWSGVTNEPSDDGSTKSVTLPVEAEAEFFRLTKP